MFSGPLPPPEALREYNDVVPGGAERILRMAEDQSAHRRQLESSVLRHDVRSRYLGIGAALFVALVGYVVSAKVILAGYEVGGVLIFGVDTSAIVGTFVYGTRSAREEREAKVKVMTASTPGARR